MIGGTILTRFSLLLILAIAAASVAPSAHASGAGAANQALGGGGGCASRPEGKAVRDCVADVLERLAAQNARNPQMQVELSRAASTVRAAANRAQALLALTQCQNVITAALKQVSASGRRVRGLGGEEGLGLIAGVLTNAIRLIQRKG